MAEFSPEQAFDRLKSKTTQAMGDYFPIEGKKNTLRLKDVWVDDKLHVDDIRSQKGAKETGRTWAVPVKAELELVDNSTGKVLDTKKMTMANLPKITRRYSYIVNGTEWQVNNQFRLKSGVYTRETARGDLEGQWNLEKGMGFKMKFDPKSRKMSLNYAGANVPLYPVLKTLGMDDDNIEKRWGKEILSSNKAAGGGDAALRQLYKSITGEKTDDLEAARKKVLETFDATSLRKDSTKMTLGKEYGKVDGTSLLAGSNRLLQVSRGKEEPDDRDSLAFKDFLSAEDLVAERLVKDARRDITRKLGNKLDKGKKVRDVVNPDIFGKPLQSFFTNSAISEQPTQMNPMNFIGGARRTTIGGQHGITDEHKITLGAQSINKSHVGFLDPIQTPESSRIGTILQMSLGTRKVGKELKMNAYNTKTGKTELVSVTDAMKSNLAFPDQYKWDKGKPIPRGADVKVSDPNGDIGIAKAKDVDYIIKSPKQMFDVAANMIPFLQSNNGNRTMVAAKQLEQGVSLVQREEPLVQTKGEGRDTFETALGKFNSHAAPVDGEVVSVRKGGITIKDASGEKHRIQTYDDFPLNDNKSVLNSESRVKRGEKVKKGQTVADTNFTRNGKLALGTNLRVAYMPYQGYNFEDGIVISESAAKKMTSEHMLRNSVRAEKDTILQKKRFIAETAGKVSADQAEKLDEFGVIKEGTTVDPGDVLIGSLKKAQISPEQQQLALFSKKALKPVKVDMQTWDKDYPGVVSKVVRHGKETTVYVKAKTPAQIGDKMVGRHGNKGIITKILPDHEMPQTKEGESTQVLLNPTGIPCYDDETEFLTTEGWVRAPDISPAHVFATLNRETLTIEFQEPSEIYHIPHCGMMYHVENQQLDMMVTPNHKQYSARRGNQKLYGTLDLDDPEVPSLFTLEEAQEIAGQPRRYLKAAKWEGELEPFYYIPPGTQSKTGPKLTHGINVLHSVWAEFMGWFLSEGSAYFNKANYAYWVEISQSKEKNPDNYRRIVEVMEWFGLPLEKTENGVRVRHKGLYERLHPLGKARHKYIPREILDMPPPQLKEFLDALMAGDGSETWNEETGHYGCRRYWTSSKKLADGVQEVAAKLGIAANIKRESRRGDDACYYISLSGSRIAPWVNWSSTTKLHQTEEMVAYDGVVHCATVPNATLFVRRNGKAVFSGNTRINLGQALETAASKIARKTGKPYVVNNFDPENPDYTRNLMKEMKKHGVSDTEALYDPKTKRKLGEVLTGEQYILKLHHTAEKGISARGRGAYDSNMQPKKGGEHSAQSMDAAGLYALLAHGATENIREMQTIKADMNDAYWTALQAGEAPPPPKVPFAYEKFDGYLKAMGVNTTKDGNKIALSPLTDKQVLAMSNGELRDPSAILRSKDLKPEPGGLFDPQVTGTTWAGGVGNFGDKWSHFNLSQRMPNPVFEAPIRALTGLSQKDFNAVMSREKDIDGRTGPWAISTALGKVDVDKRLGELEKQLPKMKGAKLNSATKEVRYLRALDRLGVDAKSAYTMKAVPVLPPNMRPMAVMENGELNTDDLTDIYKKVSLTNQKLGEFLHGGRYAEDDPVTKDLQVELYDGLKSLTMTGMQYHGRHRKGISQLIGGGGGAGSPKEGYFQKRLVGKRQDLSMRGVIVPEPTLGMDEVEVPAKAAREIYKPFIVRRLSRMDMSPGQAVQEVRNNTALANAALKAEVEERPLLLKRDPVLHKYGVQAFKPKLTTGKAIKIHPLACSGYNADFDGDKMSAFVPVSNQAVTEAYGMMPSRNLFSPSDAKLMYAPDHESMLGLYNLSRVKKATNLKFKNAAEAAKAVKEGKIGLNDSVTIMDTKSKIPQNLDPTFVGTLDKAAAAPVQTTVGRLLINQSLPEDLRDPRILSDPNFEMTKGQVKQVLTEVGKKKSKEFARTADNLKDLGNSASTGFSFGLKDLVSDHEFRDNAMKAARSKEKRIRASETNRQKRDEKIVKLYQSVDKKIQTHTRARADKSDNKLYDWVRSGARGNWDQYRQMTVAPMLVEDATGNVVPVPIEKSFSEGLDTGGYWASMFGARMGTIGRVKGTSKPGAMSKEMLQTSMSMMVSQEDCGTKKGITFKVGDKMALDRFTSQEIPLGTRGGKDKGSIPKGTLITPQVMSRLQNNKVKDVPVRTPLKCESHEGMCSNCFGLNELGDQHKKGTNVGVAAAQALGEPLTQMAMNAFHTGGVVREGGSTGDKFTRFQELVRFPEVLPGSATLATEAGTVEKVTKDRATGGYNVSVGGVKHYVPPSKGTPLVKKGQGVKRGDALTDGPKNPRELLPLTNKATVQRYLTEELEGLYGGSNVHRRNTEVFVRSLTNLAEVADPSGNTGFLAGDKMNASQIEAFNANLPKGAKPVKYKPLLRGTNVLPNEIQTDWMARLQFRDLKKTIVQGAAEGWSTDVHGVHPIPGMAVASEFGKGTPKDPWRY